MIATLKLHPIRFAAVFVCSTAVGMAAFHVPHPPAVIVIPQPHMTPVPWSAPLDEDAAIERMLHTRTYAYTPTHFERFVK